MRTTTVIIGGGQAGLAMSYCLSERGVDHVVLERGAVANRWRTHGWDSLRLLTPNWMTRLPGFQYDGSDPDGFMGAGEVVAMLERYARSARVPLVTNNEVHSVDVRDGRFRVVTDNETWRADCVVIATGHCDLPAVPWAARQMPETMHQVVPRDYRRPQQLPPGGVLVVGASASGVQLADEIHRSGRPVTLAVGQHTRLPRQYRGRDILWWFDRLGMLDQDESGVYDLVISREQPSLQLVGRDDHATLDLGVLRANGVRIVGRLVGVDRARAQFSDDLFAMTAAADYKLCGLLQRIDEHIARTSMPAGKRPPFEPLWPLFRESPTVVDLEAEGIRTVVWATGYRREYPWLRVPVLDARGEIVHTAGVTAQPGLYVLGLNFLRRRNSSFIDGVGEDARALAEHMAQRLSIAHSA